MCFSPTYKNKSFSIQLFWNWILWHVHFKHIFKFSKLQIFKMEKMLFSYKDTVITWFLMDASSFLASHDVFSFMGNFCTTQKRDLWWNNSFYQNELFFANSTSPNEMPLFRNILVLLKFVKLWDVNLWNSCYQVI